MTQSLRVAPRFAAESAVSMTSMRGAKASTRRLCSAREQEEPIENSPSRIFGKLARPKPRVQDAVRAPTTQQASAEVGAATEHHPDHVRDLGDGLVAHSCRPVFRSSRTRSCSVACSRWCTACAGPRDRHLDCAVPGDDDRARDHLTLGYILVRQDSRRPLVPMQAVTSTTGAVAAGGDFAELAVSGGRSSAGWMRPPSTRRAAARVAAARAARCSVWRLKTSSVDGGCLSVLLAAVDDDDDSPAERLLVEVLLLLDAVQLGVQVTHAVDVEPGRRPVVHRAHGPNVPAAAAIQAVGDAQ